MAVFPPKEWMDVLPRKINSYETVITNTIKIVFW